VFCQNPSLRRLVLALRQARAERTRITLSVWT
jgi:hypothetical protein